MKRITQNEDDPIKAIAKTVFFALLTGIGVGVGMYLVKKKLKTR